MPNRIENRIQIKIEKYFIHPPWGKFKLSCSSIKLFTMIVYYNLNLDLNLKK